ncbi:hypothetical protein C8R43DRAFT_1126449 [Mycena crocata]|nr:hypothetical protein C8R43DRAFT_1126449 [Mycena crocata]
MDFRGDRPPRQTRPRQSSQSSAPPSYLQNNFPSNDGSRVSAYQPACAGDPEAADHDRVFRQKSLVMPDRKKIKPGHRQWHYRAYIFSLSYFWWIFVVDFWIVGSGILAEMSTAKTLHVALPGTRESDVSFEREPVFSWPILWASIWRGTHKSMAAVDLDAAMHLGSTGNYPQREPLRRGRSLLTWRAKKTSTNPASPSSNAAPSSAANAALPLHPLTPPPSPGNAKQAASATTRRVPRALRCSTATSAPRTSPPPMMRACGLKSFEQQRAWRNKMGLMSIVLGLMAGVGFITFGFTQAVCGTPPNHCHGDAIGDGNIGKGSVVINGYDYDFGRFSHPRAGTTFPSPMGRRTRCLWAGRPRGQRCELPIPKREPALSQARLKPNSSSITGSGVAMDWYFPCNVFPQGGATSPNVTAYGARTNCHASSKGQLATSVLDDVRNTGRSLAVFESSVLDFELLAWLDPSQITPRRV